MSNFPVELLQGFMDENRETLKGINTCLTDLKARLGTVEGLCENSRELRQTCFAQQLDVETRMRIVEKIIPKLEDLPDDVDKLDKKFDGLTWRVGMVVGSMGVITVIIGWVIRNTGG